jgi:hypothetical protein
VTAPALGPQVPPWPARPGRLTGEEALLSAVMATTGEEWHAARLAAIESGALGRLMPAQRGQWPAGRHLLGGPPAAMGPEDRSRLTTRLMRLALRRRKNPAADDLYT